MTPETLADAIEDAIQDVLMFYKASEPELINQAFELVEQRIDAIKEEYARAPQKV